MDKAAGNSELILGGGNSEFLARLACLPRWPLSRPPVTSLACLAPRERAVFCLIARGYSQKQAAGILGVGRRTVDKQLEQIRRRIGTRDRVALCRLAIRAGWMEP